MLDSESDSATYDGVGNHSIVFTCEDYSIFSLSVQKGESGHNVLELSVYFLFIGNSNFLIPLLRLAFHYRKIYYKIVLIHVILVRSCRSRLGSSSS